MSSQATSLLFGRRLRKSSYQSLERIIIKINFKQISFTLFSLKYLEIEYPDSENALKKHALKETQNAYVVAIHPLMGVTRYPRLCPIVQGSQNIFQLQPGLLDMLVLLYLYSGPTAPKESISSIILRQNISLCGMVSNGVVAVKTPLSTSCLGFQDLVPPTISTFQSQNPSNDAVPSKFSRQFLSSYSPFKYPFSYSSIVHVLNVAGPLQLSKFNYFGEFRIVKYLIQLVLVSDSPLIVLSSSSYYS